MSNIIALLLIVLVAIVTCVQAHPSRRHCMIHFNQKIGIHSRYTRSIDRYSDANEIDISEAPYQVSLQYLNIHVCGGSVLNNKWILTAAQCTRAKQIKHLKVRLGSSRHDLCGTVVPIRRTVEHRWSDISLVELEAELIFNDVVQPVDLPAQHEPVKTGAMATVSGWRDTQNTTMFYTFLRATRVPIVSQEDCEQAYCNITITEDELCAGYQQGGHDSCYNDSGGSLVVDGKLVGVAMKGFDCRQPEYPGVYGRVASVRGWIRIISDV